MRIGKWKIQYCNGGIQGNYYYNGFDSRISQIRWRLNFRGKVGFWRIPESIVRKSPPTKELKEEV